MDITSYGWVNKVDSVVAWQNGLKWLSKAIVTDQDPDDKKELKGILDLHLQSAFEDPDEKIKEIAIFFCLGWKKFDLLEYFWKQTGEKVLHAWLITGMEKVFASRNLCCVDFSVFMYKSSSETMAALALFFEKRELAGTTRERVIAGLLENDSEKQAYALKAIGEFILKLRVPTSVFEDALAAYMDTNSLPFNRHVDNDEFAWCLDYLDSLLPILPALDELNLLECARLRNLFFHVSQDYFSEVIVHLLRWKCLGIIRDYSSALGESELQTVIPVFARALSDYCKDFSLSFQEAESLLRFSSRGGSETVLELLAVTLDPGTDIPGLYTLFEQAYQSNDPSVWQLAFSLEAILINKLQLRIPRLEKNRQSFLADIWEQTLSSADHLVWQRSLQRLKGLTDIAEDPYVEDEFFLPLLRAALWSHASLVQREGLKIVRRNRALFYYIQEWLASPVVQYEICGDLFADEPRVQIRGLNRLVNLYFRFPVKADLVASRLQNFQEQFHLQKGLVTDLHNKVDTAVGAILEKIQ